MRHTRLLVTGPRAWRATAILAAALDEIARTCDVLTLVHGDAEGFDTHCARWARTAEGATGTLVIPEPHPADWDTCKPSCKPAHRRTRRDGTTYCPAAGGTRNQVMADLGADLGLAGIMECDRKDCRRPDPHPSHGTADCVKRIDAAGIEVRRIHA